MLEWMMILVALSSHASASAPDPVAVAPSRYEVLLDNERVRVLKFTLKPGERVPLHAHPDYVMHALTPFHVRFCGADGGCKEFEGPAGLTIFSESLVHSDENTGSSEFKVLITELKK